MSIYFPFSFLSLGAILILSSGDVTGKDVHPLMFLLTSENSLQRPYNLEVTSGFLSSKIYKFDANTGKQETMLLFCGATNKNQDQIKLIQQEAMQKGIEKDIISKNCLFLFEDTKLKFLADAIRDREFIICEEEPEPLISRILSDYYKPIRCGPEDIGVLYRHGYQIWLEKKLFYVVLDNLGPSLTKSEVFPYKNIIDFEIFRICYDIESKQVLHTQHRVISPKLLGQSYLTQQIQKQYTISEDNFDLEELNFLEHATKYNKYFAAGVGSSSTQQQPYRLNKFVPETEFSFSLWQKPMSHVVNFDLINEKLLFLWNEITIVCKNNAAQTGMEYDVYTKTFNTHEEPTEIPQLWIKVIHQYSRAVAIIANNEMDETLNGEIFRNYCDNVDYCETFDFGSSSFNTDAQPYIMCCAINAKISELFNFNPSLDIEGPGEDGMLWIDNLIKKP